MITPSLFEQTIDSTPRLFLRIDLIGQRAAQVDLVSRRNVNGVAIKDRGFRGRPRQLKIFGDFSLASQGAIDAFVADMLAYQGKTITVVDSNGTSNTKIAIINVIPFIVQPTVNPIGGNAGAAGTHTAEILMDYVDTDPGP